MQLEGGGEIALAIQYYVYLRQVGQAARMHDQAYFRFSFFSIVGPLYKLITPTSPNVEYWFYMLFEHIKWRRKENITSNCTDRAPNVQAD